MKDLEIFDKNGKVLHIADVMRSFLKENLKIYTSNKTEGCIGCEYNKIITKLYLGDELISESCVNVR